MFALLADPRMAVPTHIVPFERIEQADELIAVYGRRFVARSGIRRGLTLKGDETIIGTADFKVVRGDIRRPQIGAFAVNRIAGPASKLPREGFERSSHRAFGPDDALYVVDRGEIEITGEKGGVRMQAGSGSPWRRRSELDAGPLTGGRLLGKLIAAAWPRRMWPAYFPSGAHVRVLLMASPRVQIASIRRGRLPLAAPWLRRPARLLPLGIYLPNQIMELPEPWAPDGRNMAAGGTHRPER